MVAPLNIARGTQNKIPEAVAMGVPVVTSRGRGVDAVTQADFLVADSYDDYSADVLSILEDPLERARLAGAGHERELQHHTWAHSMPRLDSVLERCLSGHHKAH